MIHNLTSIHPKAQLGEEVVVEPFSTIHENVEIGAGTWIGSNVTIMEGARIGKNCKIFEGLQIPPVTTSPIHDDLETYWFRPNIRISYQDLHRYFFITLCN